jgi:hypothetical protein
LVSIEVIRRVNSVHKLMDEMIAENNRLIRDLMFAKKAIKSLENITTFAIELTQEVDCDCKPSTVQRIRADIQTHLTSYESFKQQITADDSTRKTSMAMTDDNAITDLISDQDVKPKTTEITRVCHHCQQIICKSVYQFIYCVMN